MDDRSGVLDAGVRARLERLGGPALVEGMIALFEEHAPERVERARLAAADANRAGVGHAAHSLKSIAANLGAGRLFRLAETLEIDIAAGGPVDLEGRTRELERELEAIRATLARRAGDGQ